MNIIGLTGPAGSGKDFAGQLLIDHLQYAKRFAFADPIKSAFTDVLGQHVPTMDKKECPILTPGITLREILQKFGTEFVRAKFGADFWIRRLEMDLARLNKGEFAVITDVRFDDEAAWVKSKGGLVVAIDRPMTEEARHAAGHASEAGVNHRFIDFTIANHGTKHDLDEIVGKLAKGITSKLTLDFHAGGKVAITHG